MIWPFLNASGDLALWLKVFILSWNKSLRFILSVVSAFEQLEFPPLASQHMQHIADKWCCKSSMLQLSERRGLRFEGCVAWREI